MVKPPKPFNFWAEGFGYFLEFLSQELGRKQIKTQSETGLIDFY